VAREQVAPVLGDPWTFVVVRWTRRLTRSHHTGLGDEIINIGEGHSGPITVLEETQPSAQFSLSFERVRLQTRGATPMEAMNRQRVDSSVAFCSPFPTGAHSSCGSVSAALGSPPKYSKASIKQRISVWAFTALDERHKAHARVAEDRGEAVEFVGRSSLLILKLPQSNWTCSAGLVS